MSLIQNVYRRGGLYWWRRPISVGEQKLTVALSLRTADPNRARSIALKLGAAVEDFRMAYLERGSVVDQPTLKKIFGDAMRWQLDRILEGQADPLSSSDEARLLNKVSAEFWRNHAHRPSRRELPENEESEVLYQKRWVMDGHERFWRAYGASTSPSVEERPKLHFHERWTLDDHERLCDLGWTKQERLALRDMCDRYGDILVSSDQLARYCEEFGFAATSTNIERVRRVIFQARARACEEASRRLDGEDASSFEDWAAEAMLEEALSPPVTAPPPTIAVSTPAEAQPAQTAPATASPAAPPGRPKKLLMDALEECIAEHERLRAWDQSTSVQARTAVRLFDFACGGNAYIEDIEQQHVRRLGELFNSLPNRWGRTKEEAAGGIAASLRRAETMPPGELGLSQSTKVKHIGFIEQVLAHAVGDADFDENHGHRPAKPISFAKIRKGIGKNARKRDRDLRANWTKKEIERLLAAPIWFGAASLDRRFEEGPEVYHDAWYWLPVMFVLYGGRSAELVGLELTHVFEDEPIPRFLIDYTDLRRIKNAQSIRNLPIHPELIRLGFLDYVREMRALGHRMLFPEMYSPTSETFASTFYKSIFHHWRAWGFPEGTSWRHKVRGAWKDKDVHSFRGAATSLMKGKVPDSVRIDILGHEGEDTMSSVYDEEAALDVKFDALKLLSVLTQHIERKPLRLRPVERQKFGAKRGRPPKSEQG